MSASDMLAVGATIAGLAMALSPSLQIRRMRRTRSSNDVSLLYLSMLSLGFIVWIAYGYSISNWVLAGTNSASLAVMVITLVVALRYRRGGARRAAAGLAVEAEAKTAKPAAPPPPGASATPDTAAPGDEPDGGRPAQR